MTTASRAAYSGVKFAGNKVRDKLIEKSTSENMALATLGAGALTSVMLKPAGRAAICTFLGLSIQISNITLTLMMIGIYAAWMGVKGFSSFAGAASSFAKDFSAGFNEGANPTPKATSQKVAETVSDSPRKAEPTISTEELVEDFMTFTDEKSKKTQESSNNFNNTPAKELVEEFTQNEPEAVLEQQPQISSNKVNVQDELTKHASEIKLDPEEFETFTKEQSQNTNEFAKTPTKQLEEEVDQFLMDKMFEDLQQSTPTTPELVQNPDVDLDTMMKDWEMMESTAKAPPKSKTKKKSNAGYSTSLPPLSELLNQKNSSLNVGKMVSEFSNYQTGNEWAKEFAMDQAKKTNNANLILGAVVVGTGVFAAYHLYKELTKETDEPVEGTSFGSVSSSQFIVDEDEKPSMFSLDFGNFSNDSDY